MGAGLSKGDVIASLDVAASIDPVIVSADPEVRRTSVTAFQVRRPPGAGGAFRFLVDSLNKRLGWSTIDGSFTPGVMWDGETQGGDFFLRSTVYSSGLDDETEWVARKAHGTKAAPLALGDNSDILEWEINGYDGAGFTVERASMTIRTSQAWAVGANGVEIAFRVTTNGTAVPFDAFRIENDGNINILAGGLQIGSVTVFEADRDLAINLIPNADSTLDLGSPSRRFDQVIGNLHEVYAAAADAVPSSRLESMALLFGPGGAGALDTRLRRTGVSKAVIDANTALERFVFDGATSFFGVNDFGTTFSPLFPIHVQDGGGIFATIDIDGYGGAAAQFLGRSNAGTPAAPASIGAGVVMAGFAASGHDGVGYSFLGDGGFVVASSQPFAVGAHGTELQFYVTLNGTAALYAAGIFQNDGDLDILVGGLEIGNVQVFEADRDLAVSLIPNADGALTLGSSSRRFSQAVANQFDVFAAAGDAQPTARLSDTNLLLGPGGAGALDLRYRRAGTSLGIFDNNGSTNRPWIIDAALVRVGLSSIDNVFVPAFDFHAEKQGSDFDMVVDNYGGNFTIIGRGANGTKALPTALADDGDMLEVVGRGYDGVAFSGNQGSMLLEADGAWTAISHGTKWTIRTTPNGSLVQQDSLEVRGAGAVNINVGEFEMGGVDVFEADRDVAITLLPNADGVLNLGSGARRWNNVRCVTLTTGDMELEDPEMGSAWTVREAKVKGEDVDVLYAINRRTGKKYRVALEELA